MQAALRYPAAARMMGVTGRTRVAFAYRDGAVDGIGVVQSAGTPMLDVAALAAVRSARYPPPSDAIAGQTLRLLVWVEFLPGQDGD